jgi:hypothetical protein
MIRSKTFRLCGSTVVATLILVSLSAGLPSGLCAQIYRAPAAVSAPGSAEAVPFVTAPSLPLTGRPAAIAMGDLRHAGKLDLVTADPTSGEVTVFLGLGEGKFAAGVRYQAGPHPGSIAVADLHGDGAPDVIVADELEGTVSVLAGRGDGTLMPRQSFAAGLKPTLLAVGDFRGNGKADVAAVAGNRLALLPNDGKGGLGNPIAYALRGVATAIVAADLNRDGHTDIALANADGTVSILLGNGDGSFRSAPDLRVADGPLSSIAAAELTRDGNIDLIVTPSQGKLVSIFKGNGTGGFVLASRAMAGNNPVASFAADVYGEGNADLIVLNKGSNSFSVLGGNGDATFRPAQDYLVGQGPVAAVAGDLYGHGHIDLAVLSPLSGVISLARGVGDGTFQAARSYAAEFGTRSVATGDLNGDGRADIVVANECGADSSCKKGGSISVFLAEQDGSFRPGATYPLAAGPHAIALADIDGDHILDVIVLNRTDKTVSILRGAGDGSFEQPVTFSVPDAPVAVAAGDFAHRGIVDLAVVGDCGEDKCSQPGTLSILRGVGDGGFQFDRTYTVGFSPLSIAFGRLTSQSSGDLVVANRCGSDASCKTAGTASIFLGDGLGEFKPAKGVAIGMAPTAIALRQMGVGGASDLVVARSGDNSVAILHGNGDGSFAAPTVYAAGVEPRSIAIADFDGDGLADVAVGNFHDSTVSVLLARADGTLSPAVNLPVGNGPESLAVLDNGTSGHASLVTANRLSGDATPGSEISVLANIHSDGLPEPKSVMLKVSQGTVNVDGSVKLTATVTGAVNKAPTGNVTFTSSPNAIPDCIGVALTADQATGVSTVSCSTLYLQAPNESLTAEYLGDTHYASENSSPLTETVNPIAATIGLGQAATQSRVNESTTFTATVTPSKAGVIKPAGTVTFTFNGNPDPDCKPNQKIMDGQAVCTTNSLTAGSYTVEVTYTPDANFNATTTVTTASVTHKVIPQPATLIFGAATPSLVDGTVSFTATLSPTAGGLVSPNPPDGTVTFTVDGSSTDCAPVTGVSSTAVCTTTFYTAQTHTVTATYSDDLNFTVAGTATVHQTVNKATPMVGVTGPSTANVNDAVKFTATVTAPGTGTGVVAPTGAVTFTQGANNLCSAPVTLVPGTQPNNNQSTASCTHTFTTSSSGPLTITATYNAKDPNYLAGTPGTTKITIGTATPNISLTSSNATPTVNQTTILKATVNAASGVQPQGTVAFAISPSFTAASPCTPASVQLVSGVATCTITFLSANTYTVTASYTSTNSGAFNNGTPVTINPVVGQTATSLTIAPTAPASVVINNLQTQPLAVTVTSAVPGKTVPSGTVTVTDAVTGNVICAVKLKAGSLPSCPAVFFTSAVSHALTANYPGDGNFIKSSPVTVTQAVTKGNTAITAPTVSVPASIVNQQVTLSTTVSQTPALTGAGFTTPAGPVAIVITPALVSPNSCPLTSTADTANASVTDSCSTFLGNAGSYSISSTYDGGGATDSNFIAPATAPTPTMTTVSKAPTTVSFTSAPATVIATNSLASPFTAQVTEPGNAAPHIVGTIAPAGNIAFSTNDTVAPVTSNCGTTAQPSNLSVVPVSGSPAATASCNITFAANDLTGTVTLTAQYAGDNTNFLAATTSATTSITVQNYTPTVTITEPGVAAITATQSTPVTVAIPQGFPVAPGSSFGFTSATSPTLGIARIGNYASTLNVGCTVTPSAGGVSCTPSLTYTASDTGSQSIGLTSTANATGTYTVTLNPVDAAAKGLLHPVTFTVNVAVPALAGISTSGGTANVTLNSVPSGLSASSLYCPNVIQYTGSGTFGTSEPASTLGITCSGWTLPGSAGPNSLSFTITTSGSTTAALQRFGPAQVLAAGLLGTPLFILLGLFSRTRSRRQAFLRFLGVVALVFAGLQGMGCGGGFKNTGVSAQTYDLQISSDSAGNSTVGIVRLSVGK